MLVGHKSIIQADMGAGGFESKIKFDKCMFEMFCDKPDL